MTKDFENLNIWLTGASRGIGAAIARKLADTGAALFLSARSPASFKNMAAEFGSYQNVYFYPCDISSEEQVARTYSKIRSFAGGIDILINNAGVGVFKPLTDFSQEDYYGMFDVNVKGVFLCLKSVLPGMLEKGKGAIINIQSVSAITAYKFSSLYGASKAAALAMSRSLRNEVRDKGVKIVDILPGATETEIWEPHLLEKYSHRMMKPEDIADSVHNIIDLCLNERMMLEEVIIRPQGGDL